MEDGAGREQQRIVSMDKIQLDVAGCKHRGRGCEPGDVGSSVKLGKVREPTVL